MSFTIYNLVYTTFEQPYFTNEKSTFNLKKKKKKNVDSLFVKYNCLKIISIKLNKICLFLEYKRVAGVVQSTNNTITIEKTC